MPDLITHVAFASFFADRKYRWVFFLFAGAVLPDVTRLFFLFIPNNHSAYWFFSALHSPAGLVLLTLLLVFFFAPEIRKSAWLWMLYGIGLHLLLDVFQRHLSQFSYPWLFPFSFYGTGWGLFWPEDPLYVAPFLAVAAIIFYLVRRRKIKRAAVSGVSSADNPSRQ